MTGQRLLAVFVALVAVAAVLLVAWLIWFRPARTVVRERPVVTVPIVASPATPLPRDSIREATKRKLGSGGSKTRNGAEPLPTRTTLATPSQPRSPARKHTPTRSTPDRRRPSQGSHQPAQPAQPANPHPSQQPPSRPPPVVTVPPPSVCVDSLVHVGDCP